jgi:hypothetical protein
LRSREPQRAPEHYSSGRSENGNVTRIEIIEI